jgi:tetratricopeptide (TPR) repeat protein
MARTVTPKVAALIERGMQLVRAGEFAEAAKAFERALQQMPELAEVHAMRSDALMRAERLEPALASAERALRLRPGWGEALMLRGNIEALLKRFAAAEASFREAIGLLGPLATLHGNLGNVLFEQERFAEALEAYERAAQGGVTADLLAKRAKTLYALGRREDAEQAWEQVLEREPASLEAMEQLLQLYVARRQMDKLEALCARAVAVAPEAAVFRSGEAMVAAWRGREDESLARFRQAAELAFESDKAVHYDAVISEAMSLFKLGRWREGWARYRWRLDREALRAQYPRLAPEPAALAAAPAPLRIRIHVEQGVGDELFFLRFAPLLRSRGHRLSYRTHVKLIPLLQGRGELFDGIGREDEADPLECDVELQSSDLALASGAELAPPLPLAVDDERRGGMAARLREFGPPPYIGVTWRAGLVPEEQKELAGKAIWVKRAPIEELGELLGALPASVVILQRKPAAADRASFLAALGREALDASDANDDLRDALALLSLLDEYVGVSNTNMHLLAGLADRRARVLLQQPPEWRWGRAGNSSVWFPGFQLYRATQQSSWSEAMEQLASDLNNSLKNNE